MANKENLLRLVAQQVDPRQLQAAVDQIEFDLRQDPDVTPEAVDELIRQLEFVAENPDRYKDVVTQAIQAGLIDPADVPPEFDPVFIATMLLALYELKGRGSQGYAKGGLTQAAKRVAAAGRGGDTMLAHINPKEAEVLRRMGGSGTINPNTGLREYKGGIIGAVTKVVKSVAKAVVPIVATSVLGPAGGAVAGAAMGALGGGGLKGALLGGVTGSLIPGGYLGDVAKSVGTGISSIIPSSISSALPSISPATLGAGVLGGLTSAATGQGFIPGALTAGGMAAATPTLQGMYDKATGPGGIFSSQAGGTGVNLANSVGNAGVDLSTPTSGTGVNLTGFNPADAVKDTSGGVLSNFTQSPTANAASNIAAAADKGILGTGITGSQALTGLTVLNSLGGMTVPQAQEAISQNSALSAEQKAALNRELTNYTAQWNMTTLPSAGTPEYDDMFNKIKQGIGIMFMQPALTEQPTPTVQAAHGGPLSRLASGVGDGRSDNINARLSDGEYVIDAETVALLGNGSTKAGAAKLDQMRQQLRKQKGKAMAKGKFSPNAMSPLAYMKGGLK